MHDFRQLSVHLLHYDRLDGYYLYRFQKNYYTQPLLQRLLWINNYRYNFKIPIRTAQSSIVSLKERTVKLVASVLSC